LVDATKLLEKPVIGIAGDNYFPEAGAGKVL
jgi:hypothetical protein